MPSGNRSDDPRPQLQASLDQLEKQIDALEPADLDRPTPCGEYDVRTLLAHLVAVLRKLVVVRNGGDMTGVADPADDLTDDVPAVVHRARVGLDSAWASDPCLDDSYTVAWGTMTGRELLDAYTHEFTVHAWDLARAIGSDIELDPDLAEIALEWFRRNVPPEDRSPDGPFAPVVPVADDAPVYERLAGFVGRPVPDCRPYRRDARMRHTSARVE